MLVRAHAITATVSTWCMVVIESKFVVIGFRDATYRKHQWCSARSASHCLAVAIGVCSTRTIRKPVLWCSFDVLITHATMINVSLHRRYLPAQQSQQESTLNDKRREYRRMIRTHYSEKRLPSQCSNNDLTSHVVTQVSLQESPADMASARLAHSSAVEQLSALQYAAMATAPDNASLLMSVMGSTVCMQPESRFQMRDEGRRELHNQIHVDVIRSVPENMERVFENIIIQEVRYRTCNVPVA
jgi:hypothetical protein